MNFANLSFSTGMKRKSSLVSRPSPYHTAVTLFEAGEGAVETVVRRSKRLKTSLTTETPVSEPVETEKHAVGEDSPLNTPVKSWKKITTTIKLEEAEESTTVAPATAAIAGPSKVRRSKTTSPRKPKTIPTALETPHPAPPRWRETYDAIKRMRSRIVAPVDTMGCDQAQLKETDPKVRLLASG